jgi:hypothetical protein
VGAVLLADRTDQTFHDIEQASRHLGVPVLGGVAEIISQQQAMFQRVMRHMLAPASVAVLAVILLAAAYANYSSLTRPHLTNTTTTPEDYQVLMPMEPSVDGMVLADDAMLQ